MQIQYCCVYHQTIQDIMKTTLSDPKAKVYNIPVVNMTKFTRKVLGVFPHTYRNKSLILCNGQLCTSAGSWSGIKPKPIFQITRLNVGVWSLLQSNTKMQNCGVNFGGFHSTHCIGTKEIQREPVGLQQCTIQHMYTWLPNSAAGCNVSLCFVLFMKLTFGWNVQLRASYLLFTT